MSEDTKRQCSAQKSEVDHHSLMDRLARLKNSAERLYSQSLAETNPRAVNSMVAAPTKQADIQPDDRRQGESGISGGRPSRPIQSPRLRRRTLLKRHFRRGRAQTRRLLEVHLMSTLRDVSQVVQKGFNPATLDSYWRRLLLGCHEIRFLQPCERRLYIPAGQTGLKSAQVNEHEAITDCDDRPTPERVFKWATAMLPRDLQSFTFFDLGAGRGRVLLMATKYNFEKIIGAEWNQVLQDDAVLNIAQYPRSLMACRDVECLYGDARQLTLTKDPAVFYFFNNFHTGDMKRTLDQIAASYRANPRRLYILMIEPENEHIILDTEVFQRIEFPMLTRLKHKIFSPYRIVAYRSLV